MVSFTCVPGVPLIRPMACSIGKSDVFWSPTATITSRALIPTSAAGEPRRGISTMISFDLRSASISMPMPVSSPSIVSLKRTYSAGGV